MYKKIHIEINPTENSAKITYASAFDTELESNILASYKLRGKPNRDRRKKTVEASNYNALGTNPRVDELTKLVKSLSAEGNPTNHLIYVVDIDLGTSILHLSYFPQSSLEIKKKPPTTCETVRQCAQTWKMYFDGASSKDSVGVGVVFIYPSKKS
jgi:hypothetical protein